MRPWRVSLLLFPIFAVLCSCQPVAAPQGFAHSEGKALIAPDGSTLSLKGMNLGNWLVPEGYMFGFSEGPQSPSEIDAFFAELIGPERAERFWKRYREKYITEDDIRYLHEAGFNNVRVPFTYRLFLPGGDGFSLLDRVVGWAEKYDMYVILDMHCAPGGQTGSNIDDSSGYPWLYDSEEAQALAVDIWTRIAAHYRDRKAVLGYDLLNEPISHFAGLEKYNARLEPFYKRLTTSIRGVDPYHIIILGGSQWDADFTMLGPPFDSNVMYTFHAYWAPPSQKILQPYLDFRERYDVPLYLGESGENSNTWIRAFVSLLDEEQIGWSFWPYKKIESGASVVAWKKPPYWDEIVAYAKVSYAHLPPGKRAELRPAQAHIDAAMEGLLDTIRFSRCRKVPGYVEALGLR